MWLLVLPAALVALSLRVHFIGRARHQAGKPGLTAVVLGARVYPDGTPSPALVDRVTLGVTLLREGTAKRLLLSGGTPDGRPTEASVMARLATGAGAPETALVLEPASRSTFENARECAAWLRANGEHEVLLVSCDFHLARACAHFRTHGLTVWPTPSLRKLSAADRLMSTAREVGALLRRPWLMTRL